MKQRGFTLIELMVSIVVLIVLTSLAVPAFQDYIEKARLRGAADQVTDLLARARATAVKNNLPVAVNAASGADGWCVGARMAAAPATDLAEPRSDTAAACACDSAPSTCMVDGSRLVLESGSLTQSKSSTMTLPSTGLPFSYTPRLGGISTNGASSSFLAAAAARTIGLTSPKGRYSLSVIVTPLGQSYVCVPAGKPPFLGYRQC